MRVIGLFVVALVLIGGGWAALWFYAAGEAGRSLDGWIAQQAQAGQHWACPHRATEGFPFAIAITCDRPVFAGRVLDEEATGSLARLRVAVGLADWHRADLTLTAPFAYRATNGETDLAATWAKLTIALGGLPDRVATTALDGTSLIVKGRAGGADIGTLTAVQADITTQATMADHGIDFTATFGNTSIPALDALVGDQQPTNIDLAGHLTQAIVSNADTLPDLLDRWRRANGSITFATARLSRGPSELALNGPLHLDPQHHLAGQLDARFIGLGPILRRYGIDPNIATAGSILNSLFGGHHGPKPSSDPNTLQLPVAFRDGRIGIGPILTPIAIPPLY